MRKPDRRIVRLLKNVDPRLSVQWNGRVSRWEIFSQRSQLRPSERCKWDRICTFWLDGRQVGISVPKPIDRWHIFFWQGPKGQYRDLDTNVVDEIQARDMWRARTKDISDDLAEEEEKDHALKRRRQKNYMQALATEHPHFRHMHQDIVRNGRYRWIKHRPINYRMSGPNLKIRDKRRVKV